MFLFSLSIWKPTDFWSNTNKSTFMSFMKSWNLSDFWLLTLQHVYLEKLKSGKVLTHPCKISPRQEWFLKLKTPNAASDWLTIPGVKSVQVHFWIALTWTQSSTCLGDNTSSYNFLTSETAGNNKLTVIIRLEIYCRDTPQIHINQKCSPINLATFS